MTSQSRPYENPSLFEWREGFRVFVVDDNVSAADSLVRLLRVVGMSAACAYSGPDALRQDLSHFDVFLLDLGMPHMDGYELARELRMRGVSAPIVALTGYGLTDDRARTREAGFAAHLLKPAGLKEIRETLSTLIAA